jgi:hypothetical protein
MKTNETFLFEDPFTRTGFTLDYIPRIRRRINYSTRLLELETVFFILVARIQTPPDYLNPVLSPTEDVATSQSHAESNHP